MRKCENCGDIAPTTLGLCKLCQIAEKEEEYGNHRGYHMKLKPPKITPTTYASCTKKAIKHNPRKYKL